MHIFIYLLIYAYTYLFIYIAPIYMEISLSPCGSLL